MGIALTGGDSPRGHIAGHLRVLNACETEVTDPQVAVLVDEDVAGFEVAMYNTGGVDIFQTALNVADVSTS